MGEGEDALFREHLQKASKKDSSLAGIVEAMEQYEILQEEEGDDDDEEEAVLVESGKGCVSVVSQKKRAAARRDASNSNGVAGRGLHLSRLRYDRCQVYEKKMQSAAKGSQIYCLVGCDSVNNRLTGRVMLDLMQLIKDDKKPPLNSLAYASKTWLGEDMGKLDMDFHDMFRAHASGDPMQRWKIVEYCARDSEAVLWLIDRLTYVPILREQGRVCFTQLHDICNSGQQRKVYNNMAARVRGGLQASTELQGQDPDAPPLPIEGFCLNQCLNEDGSSASGWPNFKIPPSLMKKLTSGRGFADYQGATVFDPWYGFYTKQNPTASLDFAALYPSIIRAYNLCVCNLITCLAELQYLRSLGPEKVKFLLSSETPDKELDEALGTHRHVVVEYKTTHVMPCLEGNADQVPEGATVTTQEGKHPTFEQSYYMYASDKGVLPRMLADMHVARKSVKRMMKDEKDPYLRAVYNGRQLALKISANSVYGFQGTGVNGMYPCKPIAAIVTLSGRKMIDQTKEIVERDFKHYGAKVIYGDTDSVMVKLRENTSLEDAWKMGEEMAERASNLFRKPHELEMEEIKAPFLLFPQKKTYAAMAYEMGKDGKLHGHVLIKGLDPVRRDKTIVLRQCSEAVLRALIEGEGEQAAFEVIVDAVAGILNNTHDYS